MRTIDDIKIICYLADEEELALVRRFLSLPGKNIIRCEDERDMGSRIEEIKAAGIGSKEAVILAPFKGRLFQKCPGSPGMICCNYRLINTCFDCLYDCTYCFLGSYLNAFGIVQFTNLDGIMGEIASKLDMNSGMIYRIGTGEFTDSLMMDRVTGIAESVIRACRDYPNVMPEFKTKSDNVDHLLDIPEKGNAVLAWSLNTERNISLYERDTASLGERIGAARRACAAGFRVAFHFDPMIRYEGYLDEYRGVLDQVWAAVDPSKIMWISLGCFRYAPGFKETMRERFPDERLSLEEMVQGPDGKFRYLARIREEAYSFMLREIRGRAGNPFVYLCMEGPGMWHRVFGARYDRSEELESEFSEHLKKCI
ncbi:MAG TPA: hypothetical protein P5295_16930 [Spirochaetota bacterium]|nr:hypothetical protein [Spirochaetota bacterium]